MLVKALDSNRVKILIEESDVEKYDLPFERINYDDPISKKFIYELIQKAYEVTGMDFKDRHIMIEVIPGVSKTYYVLLTSLSKNGNSYIEFDKAEKSEEDVYIYKALNANSVLRFASLVCNHTLVKKELYWYRDSYYIVLSYLPISEPDNLIDLYEEFANRCRFDYINESVLREHGEFLKTVGASLSLCVLLS